MIRRVVVVLALVAAGSLICAEEDPSPRFTTVAICIDPGSEPLAAWQIELVTTSEVVGIEGGDTPFETPAYYDEAAFTSGRLILASFATGKKLHSGVQRVATVHTMESRGRGTYALELQAAGDEAGNRIAAKVWSSRDECRPRGTS